METVYTYLKHKTTTTDNDDDDDDYYYYLPLVLCSQGSLKID